MLLIIVVDLGRKKVRVVQGEDRPGVERDRLGDGEAYTINLMVMADDSPSFCYNIVAGASSGKRFVQFWLTEAYHYLHDGDTVILDNMNFHVTGVWSDLVQSFFKDLNVNYYALPKYSPELNPAELVFSKLKGCLQGKRQDGVLITAIMECLETIKTRDVLKYYIKRGYL